MSVVLSSTGSEFHSVETAKLVGPCELSVFEERQTFHAWPIVDAGSHYRLVKSSKGINKECEDSSTVNCILHAAICLRSQELE